jgi:chemotaxis response regulator CheB
MDSDHLGVEVCGLARNAETGLEMASELAPDVVLIDVSFDLQGIDLAKELRDVYSIPVIRGGLHWRTHRRPNRTRTTDSTSAAEASFKWLPLGAPCSQGRLRTE